MANLNFSEIIVAGRVTKDIELKTTQSGKPVATISLAVSRGYGDKKETDFFDIVAFDKTAETASQYFHKGSSMLVTGTPRFREWTDKQGQKRKVFEIAASRVCFVDSRSDAEPSQQAYVPDAYAPAQPAPKFETVSEDEELPF